MLYPFLIIYENREFNFDISSYFYLEGKTKKFVRILNVMLLYPFYVIGYFIDFSDNLFT